MKKTTRIVRGLMCAVMALAATGHVAAQQKGEEWEWAMTVDMDGMKLPMPPTKSCVRPDEGYTPPVEKHCQMKDRKVSGSTTAFLIVCSPPTPGEMKGQFTRKGDRVEGRYTHTQGGDSMIVITNGRKLGACDPAQLPTGARK